jgi:hypothetical protein
LFSDSGMIPFVIEPNLLCHPDRSEAKWRDLRLASRQPSQRPEAMPSRKNAGPRHTLYAGFAEGAGGNTVTCPPMKITQPIPTCASQVSYCAESAITSNA